MWVFRGLEVFFFLQESGWKKLTDRKRPKAAGGTEAFSRSEARHGYTLLPAARPRFYVTFNLCHLGWVTLYVDFFVKELQHGVQAAWRYYADVKSVSSNLLQPQSLLR